MADKTTNQAMNDFIRGIRRTAPPAQPDPSAPPRPPVGNAGAGTGTPPPTAPPRSMNNFIRAEWLRNISRAYTR